MQPLKVGSRIAKNRRINMIKEFFSVTVSVILVLAIGYICLFVSAAFNANL